MWKKNNREVKIIVHINYLGRKESNNLIEGNKIEENEKKKKKQNSTPQKIIKK